jgi:hypothetical protein
MQFFPKKVLHRKWHTFAAIQSERWLKVVATLAFGSFGLKACLLSGFDQIKLKLLEKLLLDLTRQNRQNLGSSFS